MTTAADPRRSAQISPSRIPEATVSFCAICHTLARRLGAGSGHGLGAIPTRVMVLLFPAVVAHPSFTLADRITTSAADRTVVPGVQRTAGHSARSPGLHDDHTANPITPAAGAFGATPVRPVWRPGDPSAFQVITEDTRRTLDVGDRNAATARITDIQTEWDNAQARLETTDPGAWIEVDETIEHRVVRARRDRSEPGQDDDGTRRRARRSALTPRSCARCAGPRRGTP